MSATPHSADGCGNSARMRTPLPRKLRSFRIRRRVIDARARAPDDPAGREVRGSAFGLRIPSPQRLEPRRRTMKKHVFDAQWDHLRQMVGIANRLIEMLPEDKLDSHPIPNMRTPKELVVHAYGMGLRRMTEGIIAGEFEDLDEQPV